ncbi:MAG: hypothetical protein DELT_01392 [Desulfovibrio sp.]
MNGAVAATGLRPAFLYNNIAVVFACNDAYVPVLGVLIQSICDTASPENGYDLLVLHSGLEPHRISLLLRITRERPNISLRFVNISHMVSGANLFTANRPGFAQDCYYRLLALDLFVKYDKMLYLDCDMIVVTDLAELFTLDMHGNSIAGVPDFFCVLETVLRGEDPASRDRSQRIKQAHLSHTYINSGLVLFDLERIRQEVEPGYMWKLATTHAWRQHDQDVINYTFSGKIFLLPCRWNLADFVERSKEMKVLPEYLKQQLVEAAVSPSVIHYIGPYTKPWQYSSRHSIVYFWPVAVRTPFYYELLQMQYTFMQETTVLKPSRKKKLGGLFKRLGKLFGKKESGTNWSHYEIALSQSRLALQALLQGKELEYRLRGKSEVYSRERLALLALTDGRQEQVLRVTPRRRLAFEFSLCGHCNLNCKGCAHFAPLIEEDFADLTETDRSFARLGELFHGEMDNLHLLGGEPLLHPQVADFAASARRHFPVGRIEIVTNGLLLPHMDEAFWEVCRQNKIQISVTKYPIDFDYISAQALAAYYGVAFAYYGNTDLLPDLRFRHMKLDTQGVQNPVESFLHCYMANACITLLNGRLFPCSTGANLHYFDRTFGGIAGSEGDSIDIYTAADKEEILDFLSSPIPLCRYCTSAMPRVNFTWARSKRDISEWVL